MLICVDACGGPESRFPDKLISFWTAKSEEKIPVHLVVSKWVLCAQSSTKDYIKGKNKFQSVSQLFYTKVIKPQVL